MSGIYCGGNVFYDLYFVVLFYFVLNDSENFQKDDIYNY